MGKTLQDKIAKLQAICDKVNDRLFKIYNSNFYSSKYQKEYSTNYPIHQFTNSLYNAKYKINHFVYGDSDYYELIGESPFAVFGQHHKLMTRDFMLKIIKKAGLKPAMEKPWSPTAYYIIIE